MHDIRPLGRNCIPSQADRNPAIDNVRKRALGTIRSGETHIC